MVAKQVVAMRKRRGWTQQDLANRLVELGCDYLPRNAIAKIETGRRDVSVDELFALGAALHITPVDLCAPYRSDEHIEITPGNHFPASSVRDWVFAHRESLSNSDT